MPAAGISPPPPSHFLSPPCGSLFAWNWESLLQNLIEAQSWSPYLKGDWASSQAPDRAGRPGLLLGCRPSHHPRPDLETDTSRGSCHLSLLAFGRAPRSLILLCPKKSSDNGIQEVVKAGRRSPE